MRIIKIFYRIYDDVFDSDNAPNKHQYVRALKAVIFAAYPNAVIDLDTETSPRENMGPLVEAREGHSIADTEAERITRGVERLDDTLWQAILYARNS